MNAVKFDEPGRIPPHLQPLNGGSAWKVFLFTVPVSPADDFLAKLNKLMTEEGKTVNDVQAMPSTDAPQVKSPESIIRAVGDFLGKTMRISGENNAFRHLRMFSENFPTPAGQENLDQWIEQAHPMIEECDCSEQEKRKKIDESLKGPHWK